MHYYIQLVVVAHKEKRSAQCHVTQFVLRLFTCVCTIIRLSFLHVDYPHVWHHHHLEDQPLLSASPVLL